MLTKATLCIKINTQGCVFIHTLPNIYLVPLGMGPGWRKGIIYGSF